MLDRDSEVAGSITFLFTDIEGSTRLLQAVGTRYTELLATHRRLVRDVIDRFGGFEHDAEGDAFFMVFPDVTTGLRAALAVQRALVGHRWPEDGVLRIRAGLHAGDATVVDGRYYGADVHKAARICAAAHGGQTLVSAEAMCQLSAGPLPAGVELHDLGEHLLKDFDDPERLYQVEVPDLPRRFPALRAPRVAAVRLPEQRTSFVGRESELEQAQMLLTGSRLLTFVGPGGIGKTRLAIQLAASVAPDFPDGVTFVPLAPVSDPGLLNSTIAQALELPLDGRRPVEDVLADHLAPRRALLVLDNLEHLVRAAPSLSSLLDAAPRLRIIVTSRAPLELSGEQRLNVPPLPVPRPDRVTAPTASASAAVQLFVERAREAGVGLVLDDGNAVAIAAACARLDGLPLAIELAAARANVLPVSAISARLEHSLSLLTAGPQDQPDRLRSLHAAISWSYNLLTEPTRTVFHRLSVFVGGAPLDLIEQVCVRRAAGTTRETSDDVLTAITELVSQSLLHRNDLTDARYTMLETIREYATEALVTSGERELFRDRHAVSFLEFAERAAPGIGGRDSRVLLARLEREQHNVRAAMAWLVERRRCDAAMRMASALWRYWQMRGQLVEAQEWIDKVLDLPCSADVDRRVWLATVEAAGGVAYWRGDVLRAERTYRAALDTSREIGDPAWIARSLSNLAYALRGAAKAAEALPIAAEALAGFSVLDDKSGQAGALRLIAILRAAAGDLDDAERAASRARALFEEMDRPFDLAWTLRQVGMIHLKKGNPAESRRVLSEALHLFTAARDASSVPVILADLAAVARAEGDADTANTLVRSSRSLQAATGAEWARIVDRLEHRELDTEDGLA